MKTSRVLFTALVISFALRVAAVEAPKSAQKEYLEYVQAAAEFEHQGNKDKARELYRKAIALKGSQLNKAGAYIELVKLHRDSPAEGKKYLFQFEAWLKKYPSQAKEIQPWLFAMHTHFNNGDAKEVNPRYQVWAIDQKIPRLMKEEKFQEAWELIKERDVASSDVQQKVQYDLLSTLVEKNRSKTLHCESVLKRYPTSRAWNMEICRYLGQWKAGKTNPNILSSIEEQIKSEDPEKLYLIKGLKKI